MCSVVCEEISCRERMMLARSFIVCPQAPTLALNKKVVSNTRLATFFNCS